MKFFLFLFCFYFVFSLNVYESNSQNTKPVILKPDKKVGRTCEVYSNTLIIRFKKSIDNNEKAANSLLNSDATLVNPIFDRKLSIKDNKSRILSETSEKIKIIENAEEPLLRTYILHYDSDLAPEIYAKQLLKNNQNIEIAEPYYLDEIQAIPNDPYVTSQDMLYTIHAFECWDSGMAGDSSVVIGISDNGVFQGHDDLAKSIAPNWGEIPDNGIDDDGNGYTDDFKGYNFAYNDDNKGYDYTYNPADDHGTNVAGICGATVNNKIGIAGVANKCRIFPIKIAKNSDPTHLPYGYQSILYAAVCKVKVLNCSWGKEKIFSDVDQSIIDYAVAKDVAIVAAGGNGYGSTQAWYPAGYHGVLGVGEVDQSDYATSVTSLGSHIGIMAPGEGNYYTKNNNSYDNSGLGTSYASPVVAGAVALVRAKYPELSAVQSLEFIRQCTDDISSLNASSADIIPGRLNLLRASTIEPMSIPSIRPQSVEYYSNDGVWMEKGYVGDTLKLKINAFNFLGTSSNLRFVLSNVKDPLKSIEIIDPEVNISEWSAGTAKSIQYFKFKIVQQNYSQIFFRVDIYADNNYHDFFLLPYTPTNEVVTFANKSIRYSMGDRGTFGYGGPVYNLQGVGFTYKNYGNQLYTNSGLMAIADDSLVVSSVFGTNGDDNDFAVVRPYKSPERYFNIVNDSYASYNKIGLEISQSCHFIDDTLPAAKIILDVKNVSGRILKDVAVGYFLDWDIGPDETRNLVRLFPEAIPETFVAVASAAELARYDGDYPYFSAAIYSPNDYFVPQAAGLSDINGSTFTKNKQIQTLTNGTSMQFDSIGDISMVVGMKFPGEMQPGETKTFYVCVAAGDNEQSAAINMKYSMLGPVGVNEIPFKANDISIYPQPAKDIVNVRFKSNVNSIVIHLIDYLGKEVSTPIELKNQAENIVIPINLNPLPSGMYYLTIQTDEGIVSKPVIVLK
ncbi:MAG: T9SS type A sorting domain-containing protein [Bacteroidetes bacterium]|nr:MAG: T9SS type A sorting domain-containing protein [Bacteroidota bacterium]